jgi:hypothetical protein
LGGHSGNVWQRGWADQIRYGLAEQELSYWSNALEKLVGVMNPPEMSLWWFALPLSAVAGAGAWIGWLFWRESQQPDEEYPSGLDAHNNRRDLEQPRELPRNAPAPEQCRGHEPSTVGPNDMSEEERLWWYSQRLADKTRRPPSDSTIEPVD